jgi:hypothetical protein
MRKGPGNGAFFCAHWLLARNLFLANWSDKIQQKIANMVIYCNKVNYYVKLYI